MAETTTSEDFLKENLEMPIATVNRIIKNALPNNTQVAKDVKSLFSKAAGIFIIYLSTHANEICQERKKSTITAQHVLAAVREIEMEDFLPSLEKYLNEFRTISANKKRAKINKQASQPGSGKKQKTANNNAAAAAAPAPAETKTGTAEAETDDNAAAAEATTDSAAAPTASET
mmetsp:Transcript_7469/g.13929  ORF Transcript_7469/g.13929 Transcript_7469/m.13929 type:complete len:174 (-) Transcript_7469:133-654(-)|eukprot:CAMPEP_0197515722 /NCGR_PEP_ID=MMETSP1318-20131121/766_1 /TAXON_ID=552666 /ORGANISM="Partenskyella glossopodia, Strain RCC365" /LENGTH=173 /DNA_ID=CAMNT_0043064171 /DNA_START=27 /DNA_END=548 /DNA_ORIENTATION=-